MFERKKKLLNEQLKFILININFSASSDNERKMNVFESFSRAKSLDGKVFFKEEMCMV